MMSEADRQFINERNDNHESKPLEVPNDTNDVNGSCFESPESSWQKLSNNTSHDDKDIEHYESPNKSEKSTLSNGSYVNVETERTEYKDGLNEEEEEQEEEEEVEKDLDTALEHKHEGNKYFKLEQYEEALNEYDLAIKYCPLNNDNDKDREYLSIFYGNHGACYVAMEEYELAIEDCNLSIQHNDKYIKGYWRRAKSYEKLEKYYDAKCDYNKIIEIDPNHELAKENLKRIEPLVQKQFEQQKAEVIDKLKGFANWGLGKVGLSLDNFEAKQNPQTGAYNIQFKQNPHQ